MKIYNPTVVQGGVCCNLSPGFCGVTTFRKYFTCIDSLSCNLKDKVNIMGYDTAGSPWHYPKWLPTWPPSWILLKIQIYQENREIANIFARFVKYDVIKDFALFSSIL